jgi:hypothetical protein
MVVPALLIVLLDVVLPNGMTLKVVAVSGLLAFPACAYALGRLAHLSSPAPEMFAIAALVFLFDESFTIYGGNIASTMAGEFSFSISLSLTLLGFGLFVRAVEEGTHRALAAIVLALAALSHGIVLMFAFGGVVTYLALRPGALRSRPNPMINRAQGIALETSLPIATARLAEHGNLIEFDGYSANAVARARLPGHLPPGVAMTSFVVPDLDALSLEWLQPPRALEGLAYRGRRAATTLGPDGELIELIEAR